MEEYIKVNKKFQPKIGDVFYSDYFVNRATVCEYTDENNWWFVFDNGVKLKSRVKPYRVKWLKEEF